MTVVEKHIKSADKLGLWMRRGLVMVGEGLFIGSTALHIPECMILGALLWITGSMMYIPGFHPVDSTIGKALSSIDINYRKK